MTLILNSISDLLGQIPGVAWLVIAITIVVGLLAWLFIKFGRSILLFLKNRVFQPLSRLPKNIWYLSALLFLIAPLVLFFFRSTTDGANPVTNIGQLNTPELAEEKPIIIPILKIIEKDTLVSISNEEWYLFSGNSDNKVEIYTQSGSEKLFRILVKHSLDGEIYDFPKESLPAETFEGKLYVQSVGPSTLIKLEQRD